MTKVEFRELQRSVSYLRKMAEELVDECCSFETDVQELFEKSGHRSKPRRYKPLIIPCNDITDDELDQLKPQTRACLGFDPEPYFPKESDDKDCA